MFTVQWYPGHMTKAKRKIEDIIKSIDIVIELRDARIPYSSGNPDISRLARGKEHIIVLNKRDLADENKTNEWITYFLQKGIECIPTRGTDKSDVKKILKLIEKARDKVFTKRRAKGFFDRPVRCLVIGISNVGKSSLINSLSIKKVAATGNKPGITKGNQWVRIGNKIELLDTPGILWPKFEGNIGNNLALTGSISDNVYELYEAAIYLIEILVQKKYIANEDPAELLLNYGKKRGLLEKGGRVDLDKTALLYLKDFRTGKLGNYSIEWLSDYGSI